MEVSIDDKMWFKAFKENYKNELHKTDLKVIASLHSRYFGHSYYTPCGCNGKSKEQIKKWVQELDSLFFGDAN